MFQISSFQLSYSKVSKFQSFNYQIQPVMSKEKKSIDKNLESDDIIDDEFNNNSKSYKKSKTINEFANFPSLCVNSVTGKQIYYLFNVRGPHFVWRNIVLFLLLHFLYLSSFYVCFKYKCWSTWIFGKSKSLSVN